VTTEPSLLRAAVTILFGAAAGGLTNLVAIWMLFHPHERRGWSIFQFQGAIPKNKPRLAKTIGRTVGQRLLSAEDLHQQLTAPGIQEVFDSAVGGFVTSVLDSERGSLRDELPDNLLPEVDSTVEGVAQIIADRVVEYASTDGFRDTTAEFLTKTRDRVADKSVGLILTGARREAVRNRVEEWVAEAAASTELDRIVGEWMDRQLVSLAADSTPLLEKLPPTLVAAIEKEIQDYLPMAIDRLAGMLRNPEARGRIQTALHELFERFVRDLMIHERIVARLVVTERTITKVLDNFEREGADQLGKLLDQPEMRAQVSHSVNDAVVSFLRKPMSDHMERLGAERLEGVKNTAAEYVATVVRDPATRRYGIDKLDQALQAAEVLEQLPEAIQHLAARRLATIESISTAVMDDIKEVLTGELLEAISEKPQAFKGKEHVAAIFNNMNAEIKNEIMNNLDEDDPELMADVRQTMFIFEDLINLVQDRIHISIQISSASGLG